MDSNAKIPRGPGKHVAARPGRLKQHTRARSEPGRPRRPGRRWTTAAAIAIPCALSLAFTLVGSFQSRERHNAVERAAADRAATQAEAEAALASAFRDLEAAARVRPIAIEAFASSCYTFAARAGISPLAAQARDLAAATRRNLAGEARRLFDAITADVARLKAAHRLGAAVRRLDDLPEWLDPRNQLRPRLRDLETTIHREAELELAGIVATARSLVDQGAPDDAVALLEGARAWGLPGFDPEVDHALADLRGRVATRATAARAANERQEAQAAATAARLRAGTEHLQAASEAVLQKRERQAQEIKRQADRVMADTRKDPFTLEITRDLKLKGTHVVQYGDDGVTVESDTPKVRMPYSWSMLDPQMAYDLRRRAYDPADPEGHFQLGRFCTLRDLLGGAQREFDLAVKLDPGYRARVPDLSRFRERKNLFKGNWSRVGRDFLRVAWDFTHANQKEDFRVLRETAANAAAGRLTLRGAGLFGALPKEVAFIDEISVTADALRGAGATPMLGIFFLDENREPTAGYLALVDGANRRLAVVRLKGNKLEPLLPAQAIPAGEISLRFAGLRFEARAGGRTVWSGDESRFSEVTILVGGVAEGAAGSVEVGRLTIEGKVSPEWVRKSLSEAETLALRELEEDLKPGASAAGTGDQAPDAPLSIEAAGLHGLSDVARESYRTARAALAATKLEKPEELAARLAVLLAAAPDFAGGHYLEGLLSYRWLGDAEAGFRDFARALELAPEFHEARVELALIYLERGDQVAARREIDRALAAAPDFAPAYVARGKLHFREHRYDASTDDLELAVELEPGRLETRTRLRNARHVQRGPFWKEVYTKETAHFTVRTDIGKEKAAEYAEDLEAAAAYYARAFGVPLKAAQKNDVLVFDTKEGYQTYAELSTSNRVEFTLGYYHPEYRQLLLFEDKADVTGAETRHVLYHEGFHQFLAPLIPDAPYWLSEGMAEYFGACEVSGGRVVREGMVLKGRLRGLQSWLEAGLPLVSFAGIMQETPAEFYGGSPVQVSLKYAQAWAMIHFFMSGREPRLRAALDEYVRLLRAGATGSAAFRKAWGDVDLEAAQRGFVRYARELK